MKQLSLTALLAIAAPVVMAQSPTPPSVTVPGYSITMPDRTMGKSASDFETYRGAYDLSNGQVLSLTASGSAMYAQLDDGAPREIAAVGYGRYVAKDLSLKITLERKADGDFGGEMWIARAPAVAGQPMEVVRLALK